MVTDIGTQLERAYDDLRGIDSNLSVLTGRGSDRLMKRKRDLADDPYPPFNSGGDRRVQDGGRRIIISTDNSDHRFEKRTRYGDDTHHQHHNHHDFERRERDYSPPSYRPPAKRSVQSSVVMPTIETKSRAAIIHEMKKHESKEDTVRNKRMFTNLLAGTLRQFQKEEQTANKKVTPQIEKQREVERRLEQTDKENKHKIQKEKEELMAKRREKEAEIVALRRKKAIKQYAEEKLQHFSRLQCFIQTQTKPPLFFLPAKHTLRTLELLKESAKKVEVLIELRREEMERELRRDAVNSGEVEDDDLEEDQKPLKSAIVVRGQEEMEEEEEEEEMEAQIVKQELDAAIVAAVEEATAIVDLGANPNADNNGVGEGEPLAESAAVAAPEPVSAPEVAAANSSREGGAEEGEEASGVVESLAPEEGEKEMEE